MFFTRRSNDKIEALYSGRYAFARALVGLEREEYFATVVESGIESYEEETLHEYRHFIVFNQSPVGMTLSGVRFYARVMHTLFRWWSPTRRYYALRTAYFLLVGETHERIVEALEEDDKKSEGRAGFRMNQKQISEAKKADLKFLRWSWNQDLIGPLEVIFAPYCYLQGLWYHKNFTVVQCYDNEGDKSHRFAARGGWVNNQGVAMPNDRLFESSMKLVSKLVQKPFHLLRDPNRDIKWLRARMSAEWQTYRKINELGEANPWNSYEKRVSEIAEFVGSWAGTDDYHAPAKLKEIMLAEAKGQAVSNTLLRRFRKLPTMRVMFNFFYLHGN